jgi:acetyltransferase-like isoleucine patch superfamily enzyme
MTDMSTPAVIKNSNIDSNQTTIEDGAKLTDVEIKGREIIIKSGATLTDCKIFSEGTVHVGCKTVIKEGTIINAFKSVSIGNGVIIDRDVFIGGMQSEKSAIEVGNDCVILYRSYLNTTRKISIGNNVGIGGYCLIFTHSAWQNVLNGNPYKFADVEIKDNAWLPWNVTVLPGVIIERDVTIGTGSTVTKSVPPYVFAAGVPAKVIRKKDLCTLSQEDKNMIVLEIMRDFQDYASKFLKLKDIETEQGRDFGITYNDYRLLYTLHFNHIQRNDIVISFKIPDEIKKQNEWIELDLQRSNTLQDIANYFISFVRRYGIKIVVEK